MAATIVFASGKGGVGKSTAAAAVASSLARHKKKTLLVDCDAGLGAAHVLLHCENTAVFSWYDLYLENCSEKDAVRMIGDDLWILNAPAEPLPEPCEDAIEKVVALVKERFDYVLLDAPAGLGTGLRRAAKAASMAVIVATGDEVCVRGASAVENVLRDLDIRQTRLLINRYDLRAVKKGAYLNVDQIVDRACARLLGIVPEDPALTFYSVTGKLKRNSKGMEAFSRIARRIRGENVPLTLSLLK